MSSDNNLAMEMAAVNMVNSQELAENSAIVSEIIDLQNKLKDRIEVVRDVKEVIESLKDREVSPDTAVILDKQLERNGALVSKLVIGAECLARDISPAEWRKTRITACENFITDSLLFLERSAKLLLSNFADAKTLLLTSINDAKKTLGELKNEVDGVHDWVKTPRVKVDLGYHLFNHLKLGNEVTNNFEAEFKRVGNVVTALTRIYYKESSNKLNDLFRIFGGIRICKTPADVQAYMHNIPFSLKNRHFDECNITVSGSKDGVSTKRSTNLIGDRYFTSTILEPKMFGQSDEGFKNWLMTYVDVVGVKFSGVPERVYEGEFIVDALTPERMHALIDTLMSVVANWEKTYAVGDNEVVSIKEMKNSLDELNTIEADKEHIELLCTAFDKLVWVNQHQLLTLRNNITQYLVLLVSALARLTRLSIEARR